MLCENTFYLFEVETKPKEICLLLDLESALFHFEYVTGIPQNYITTEDNHPDSYFFFRSLHPDFRKNHSLRDVRIRKINILSLIPINNLLVIPCCRFHYNIVKPLSEYSFARLKFYKDAYLYLTHKENAIAVQKYFRLMLAEKKLNVYNRGLNNYDEVVMDFYQDVEYTFQVFLQDYESLPVRVYHKKDQLPVRRTKIR